MKNDTLLIKRADLDRVVRIAAPQVETRLLSILRQHSVRRTQPGSDNTVIPLMVGPGLYDVSEADMHQIREILDVLHYPKFIPGARPPGDEFSREAMLDVAARAYAESYGFLGFPSFDEMLPDDRESAYERMKAVFDAIIPDEHTVVWVTGSASEGGVAITFGAAWELALNATGGPRLPADPILDNGLLLRKTSGEDNGLLLRKTSGEDGEEE